MRSDLLRTPLDDPALAAVDADLRRLLYSWFNRGFLVLRRIDWHTPAAILEKIIRYEAVHEIKGWDDLRRRLDPKDRRCFAFFHPSLVDEPLVFVEVALMRDTPEAIGEVLHEPETPIAGGARHHRRLLFDLQLPGRPQGHLLRQLPLEAGRGGARARGARRSRPSSRCRRCRALPAGSPRPPPTRRRTMLATEAARGARRGAAPGRTWAARGGGRERAQGVAAGARGALFSRGEGRRRPRHRSRRPLPPRQRRAPRAHQLDGRILRPRACATPSA